MTAEIGAYDPKTAKMILDTVRYLRANGFVLQSGQKTPPITSAPRIHIGLTTETITGRSGSDAGTGKATLLYVPGEAGIEFTIEDFPPSGAVEINVYNVDTATVASGAYVPLIREYGSGKWFVVPSAVNNPQVYVARATTAITARAGSTRGSGTVSVLAGSLGVATPAISLTVYNAYDVAIADNDYLLVCRDDIDNLWWAVPKGGGSTTSTSKRIRGTVKNLGSGSPTFTGSTGAGPFTIENIEGIDAAWAGASTITATNPEGCKLWTDTTCNVRAEYNETSGDWEIYNAQADKIVHGVVRDNCTFKQLQADGYANWTLGATAPWLTEVYQLGCQLYYSTCSDIGVAFADVNFVDQVSWDSGSERVKITYCDGTLDYVTLPFVTDVVLSGAGCSLIVTKEGVDTDYDMPYLIDVYPATDGLYIEYACGTTEKIIDFTSCT